MVRVILSTVPSAVARGLVVKVDCGDGVSASLFAAMQILLSSIDRVGRARDFARLGATLFLEVAEDSDIVLAGAIVRLFKSFFPRGAVVVRIDGDCFEGVVHLKPNDIVCDNLSPTICVRASSGRCVDGSMCSAVAIEVSNVNELERYVAKCWSEVSRCASIVVVPKRCDPMGLAKVLRSVASDIVCEPQMLIELRRDGSFEVVELDCSSVAARD